MTKSDASETSWFDRLIIALAYIAGCLMVALTALICVDVAARNFRLFAMPWTLDVAEYLLYIITFLGAPWVLRDGGHISVDLLVQNLPTRAKQRTVRAANSIGAVVCLVLFYYACRTWWRSFSENIMVHETFVFPEWILFSVAPPVFLILVVVFLQSIRRGTELIEARQTAPDGF